VNIVEAFHENNINIPITINGTLENPLFRDNDIRLILEMSNIRSSIHDFDETEKVLRSVNTLGGVQDVTFLTEKGLYQVLFMSRKPIAKKFKNWVCDIIKEIRINEINEINVLKEQISLRDKKLELKESNVEKELLNKHNKRKCLYVCRVSNNIVKFGITNDISRRLREHKNDISEEVSLCYVLVQIYFATLLFLFVRFFLFFYK